MPMSSLNNLPYQSFQSEIQAFKKLIKSKQRSRSNLVELTFKETPRKQESRIDSAYAKCELIQFTKVKKGKKKHNQTCREVFQKRQKIITQEGKMHPNLSLKQMLKVKQAIEKKQKQKIQNPFYKIQVERLHYIKQERMKRKPLKESQLNHKQTSSDQFFGQAFHFQKAVKINKRKATNIYRNIRHNRTFTDTFAKFQSDRKMKTKQEQNLRETNTTEQNEEAPQKIREKSDTLKYYDLKQYYESKYMK